MICGQELVYFLLLNLKVNGILGIGSKDDMVRILERFEMFEILPIY